MADLKEQRSNEFCASTLVLLGAALLGGCAASNSTDSGGSAGGSASTNDANGGAEASSSPLVGNFTVELNPTVGTLAAHTTIIGKAYSGPTLTQVIETPVRSNSECTVYAFSSQSCIPACDSTTQTCVGTNTCKTNPTVANLGTVTVVGVASNTLKLSNVGGNYQYAADIAYPGFAEGDTITLSTTGDYYPAFSISTLGVASLELSSASYIIDTGAPLEIKWIPGSAAVGAKINIGLNISKHGGSAGYLSCDVSDSGSYTIPGDLITALIALGVSGFPQLTMTRTASGTITVSTGVIEFAVQALANPNLQVQGYCSCFDSPECGTCADTTKTVCDTVKKLCKAP